MFFSPKIKELMADPSVDMDALLQRAQTRVTQALYTPKPASMQVPYGWAVRLLDLVDSWLYDGSIVAPRDATMLVQVILQDWVAPHVFEDMPTSVDTYHQLKASLLPAKWSELEITCLSYLCAAVKRDQVEGATFPRTLTAMDDAFYESVIPNFRDGLELHPDVEEDINIRQSRVLVFVRRHGADVDKVKPDRLGMTKLELLPGRFLRWHFDQAIVLVRGRLYSVLPHRIFDCDVEGRDYLQRRLKDFMSNTGLMELFCAPPGKKDWPWSEEENGNYNNRCTSCGDIFRGHKHSVTCRMCSLAHEEWWNSLTEEAQTDILRTMAHQFKEKIEPYL